MGALLALSLTKTRERGNMALLIVMETIQIRWEDMGRIRMENLYGYVAVGF